MKKILIVLAILIAPASLMAQSQITKAFTASSASCASADQCAVVQVGLTDTTGNVQLSGTFAGTITFEASANGGQSWTTINGLPWTGAQTTVTTATAAGGWTFDVSGKTQLRARPSAYTSGTIIASLTVVATRAASSTSATIDATGLATGVAQASTTAGEAGTLAQGAATTSAPTYTNATTNPLSLDTSGSLRVAVVSGSTGNAAASATGSAVPAQGDYTGINVAGNLRGQTGQNPSGTIYTADVAGVGTAGTAAGGVLTVQGVASMTKLLVTPDSVALPANQSVNAAQINGTTPLMGNGVSGTGAQRVTIASDSTGTVVATQPTGTNLHVVSDATSTTAVTQATASNLNATVIGAGAAGTANTGVMSVQGIASMTPVQVSQATGTNLHAVLDTTSTTAVTQATATNLKAQVTGAGTAGTADTGVQTIQGIASMTPVQTQSNSANIATEATVVKLPVAQGSTTSGQSGPLAQGAVTTAAPSYTTAQTSPLSLDTAGSLRVAVVSGSTGNAAASATGSAVPAQGDYQGINVAGTLRGQTGQNPSGVIYTADVAGVGTAGTAAGGVLTVQGVASMTKLLVTPDSVALPANQSVNIAQMNGVATTMGNGASGTGVQRVTIANDSTGIVALTTGAAQIGHLEANQSSNVAQMNGVTVTMGNGVAGTGVQRVTLASDSTGQVALAAGSALIGQTANVATATTTNAASRCTLVSAATANSTNCKASSGNVYGFRFINTTATLYYLRMYNLASAPTCSSATGFIESIPIPASTSGAGMVAIEPMGEAYATGIGFCFTSGSTSTDNTAADTGVFGTILYK